MTLFIDFAPRKVSVATYALKRSQLVPIPLGARLPRGPSQPRVVIRDELERAAAESVQLLVMAAVPLQSTDDGGDGAGIRGICAQLRTRFGKDLPQSGRI